MPAGRDVHPCRAERAYLHGQQLRLIPADTRADQAARRAFSLAFSITQRDVVPSAELDADRKPCAVWLA
jgi:hypothetical protein